METGRKQSIVVTATSGLTEEEIQSMAEENRDYLLSAAQHEQFDKLKSEAESMIAEIERLFPVVRDVISRSKYSQDAIKRAQTTIESARGALKRRDIDSLSNISDALQRTLDTFRNLASRHSG
jgi:molecular chaperone DnaK (HSP70)